MRYGTWTSSRAGLLPSGGQGTKTLEWPAPGRGFPPSGSGIRVCHGIAGPRERNGWQLPSVMLNPVFPNP